jgi:hypothetical protein
MHFRISGMRNYCNPQKFCTDHPALFELPYPVRNIGDRRKKHFTLELFEKPEKFLTDCKTDSYIKRLRSFKQSGEVKSFRRKGFGGGWQKEKRPPTEQRKAKVNFPNTVGGQFRVSVKI